MSMTEYGCVEYLKSKNNLDYARETMCTNMIITSSTFNGEVIVDWFDHVFKNKNDRRIPDLLGIDELDSRGQIVDPKGLLITNIKMLERRIELEANKNRFEEGDLNCKNFERCEKRKMGIMDGRSIPSWPLNYFKEHLYRNLTYNSGLYETRAKDNNKMLRYFVVERLVREPSYTCQVRFTRGHYQFLLDREKLQINKIFEFNFDDLLMENSIL